MKFIRILPDKILEVTMVRISKPGPIKNIPKQKRTHCPLSFAEKRDLIRLKGIQENLSAIQKYGDEIQRMGSRYVVLKILRTVVALDYASPVMAAAREALSSITSYCRSVKPFDQFADTYIEPPPFFLGALFELLPRKTALEVFRIEYLEAADPSKKTYLKAGRSLLRFSSVEKAAEFIRALQKAKGPNLDKFLRFCQRSNKLRHYVYRRYQMSELLKLVKKKPRGFPRG